MLYHVVITMSQKTPLTETWKFHSGDLDAAQWEACADWQTVTVPHTWNNLDGQDGGNDYVRGAGWYCYSLVLQKDSEKSYWLEFLGVNSVADVYVNGQHLGQHRGGYTLFRFDATQALQNGENTILVKADNSPFPDVIPLEADFTFFGGIYREVNLITAEKTHFALDDFGADGVQITYPNTPAVRDCARLSVRAKVTGAQANTQLQIRVLVPNTFDACKGIEHTDFAVSDMISATPRAVAEKTVSVTGNEVTVELPIQNPHLWNGRKDPFRYKVVCTLSDGTKTVDCVEKAIGIRFFEIHPQNGFFLNGKSYPLRGVNRHQDRENMGNAITLREHDEDFSILYEIGANAVRLAHYPHHPHFYDRCDQYGLLVWAEIPFVNHIGGEKRSPLPTDTEIDPAVTARQLENAKQQMTELILQQGYRPSIFCWSMSNEVMREYGDTAAHMMQALDDLIHALDSTRYSAMALNHTYGYRWSSDVKGCNIYPGWYVGKPSHFRYQSNYHMRGNARRGVAVSEYGAGSNILHHTEHPRQPKDTTCDFHPEEWASIVHEHALRYFMSPRRNKIWGTFVWNLFDFAVDIRSEGAMPGKNDKGLVTHDRKTKKDPFYLYKAYWSSEPVTYITSRRFTKRERSKITVKVYSNADSVELLVNGQPFRTKEAQYNRQAHVFLFKGVRLQNGENTVQAKGDNGVTDTVVWQYGDAASK